MKRTTANFGDAQRYFGSEDGKHYRGIRQNIEPLKRHIEHLHHKVNEAPSSGNRNQWAYRGSIPMALLTEWLWKTKTPMHDWAVNRGGAKDQFLKWLQSEHPKLMPKAGAAARPQIVVPTTYKVRANG
jgi:hypothetical protein